MQLASLVQTWKISVLIYLFICSFIYLFIGRLASWKKADKSMAVQATAFGFKAQSDYNKGLLDLKSSPFRKLQPCVTHPTYHWAMIKVNEITSGLPLGLSHSRRFALCRAHSRCFGFPLELKWNNYCIAALLDIWDNVALASPKKIG